MKNAKIKFLQTACLTASVATLAACSPHGGKVLTQFFREAGSITDSGDFGNSTSNNTLIQTGELDYTINLAKRFASDVNSMVNFEFNSTQLDAGAQATLREQANWIRQFPEIKFRVYGHADAIGSRGYNKSLGLRRANAVVRFLGTQGISRRRLEAIASFGETQPLIVTQGRERRNRRTVTEVSGFVQSNQAVLDGKYAQIVYRDYVESAVAPTGLSGSLSEISGE